MFWVSSVGSLGLAGSYNYLLNFSEVDIAVDCQKNELT